MKGKGEHQYETNNTPLLSPASLSRFSLPLVAPPLTFSGDLTALAYSRRAHDNVPGPPPPASASSSSRACRRRSSSSRPRRSPSRRCRSASTATRCCSLCRSLSIWRKRSSSASRATLSASVALLRSSSAACLRASSRSARTARRRRSTSASWDRRTCTPCSSVYRVCIQGVYRMFRGCLERV